MAIHFVLPRPEFVLDGHKEKPPGKAVKKKAKAENGPDALSEPASESSDNSKS